MDATKEPNEPQAVIHAGIYAFPDLRHRSDDWTGVTSTAERKKRQNRLNQRAYRRRKKAQPGSPETSGTLSPAVNITPPGEREGGQRVGSQGQTSGSRGIQHGSTLVDGQMMLYGGPSLLTSPSRVARTRELIRQAYEDHMLHAPRPENLPVLIRLNAMNALARNATRMGFPVEGLCHDDLTSPFNAEGPMLVPSCPGTLQPTPLQRTIEHHPWIDLFPFPRFRDNFLRAMVTGFFDEDELCCDILEVEGGDMDQKPSLMIWGESWDYMGWEASESFFRKWGWLLRGCPEILESTNYWRGRQGKKRLASGYAGDLTLDSHR